MSKPTTYLFQIGDTVKVIASTTFPSYVGKVTITDEQESEGHITVADALGDEIHKVPVRHCQYIPKDTDGLERLLALHNDAKARGVSPYPMVSKLASHLSRCNITSGTLMLAEGVRVDVWIHGKDDVPACEELMLMILNSYNVALNPGVIFAKANDTFNESRLLAAEHRQTKERVNLDIKASGLPQEQHIELLSHSFCTALKRDLGQENFIKMVRMNKRERDKNICHSHTFVDANQSMLDTFRDCFDRDAEVGVDTPDMLLMNEAWSLARTNHFYTDTQPVTLQS